MILAGLAGSGLTAAQKARFGLLSQPLTPGWLRYLAVSADKDCTLTFGCYDGTNFYGSYSVTLLAAGSNEHTNQLNTGLMLPLGGNLKPAIKVIVGTAVTITGHVEIVPNTAERDATPIA